MRGAEKHRQELPLPGFCPAIAALLYLHNDFSIPQQSYF